MRKGRKENEGERWDEEMKKVMLRGKRWDRLTR